jgi:hypothetical protein
MSNAASRFHAIKSKKKIVKIHSRRREEKGGNSQRLKALKD